MKSVEMQSEKIAAVFFLQHSNKSTALASQVQPTRRFLALEIANQLDDLIHVVEALQFPLVVNDLYGVFNHLANEKKHNLLSAYCEVTLQVAKCFYWTIV